MILARSWKSAPTITPRNPKTEVMKAPIIIKTFSLICFLFLTGTLSAQFTSIPDAAFEQYLVNQGIDSDGTVNGQLATADAAAATNLNLFFTGITNYSGIEDFTGLVNLKINTNTGGSIPASAIQGMTSLQTVELDKVNVSGSIDFSAHSNLQTWTTNDTGGGTLDFSGCPSIQSVLVFSDSFDDIEIGSQPNLVSFYFQDNSFSTRTAYDFSACPLIQSITLAFIPTLSDVDVSGCTQLQSFDLNRCGEDSDGFDLDFSSCGLLESFDLEAPNFYLNPVNVAFTVNLANGNNALLTDCSIEPGVPLLCIQVDDPQAAETNSGPYADWVHPVESSFSVSCNLVYVPDDELEQKFINLGLDENVNDYVRAEDLATLTNFNSFFEDINNFKGIEACVGLQDLFIASQSGSMQGNAIEAMTLLQSVDLDGVNVQGGIDFSAHDFLQTFQASGTGGGTLDFSGCPSIESIFIFFQTFSDVIIGNQPNLTYLYYEDDDINNRSFYDFSGCPLIETIILESIPGLTDVNLTGCTQLQRLELDRCGINGDGIDLDLTGQPVLTTLFYRSSFNFGGNPGHITLNLKNGQNALLNDVNIQTTGEESCVLVDQPILANGASGVYASWILDSSISFADLDGCTNPIACNYDSSADCDDGSCDLGGCTDPTACNYSPTASCDNGNCAYPGCTNPQACNFDANASCDDGSCTGLQGCLDPTSLIFDANSDCDGACAYCEATVAEWETVESSIVTSSTFGDSYLAQTFTSTVSASDVIVGIPVNRCFETGAVISIAPLNGSEPDWLNPISTVHLDPEDVPQACGGSMYPNMYTFIPDVNLINGTQYAILFQSSTAEGIGWRQSDSNTDGFNPYAAGTCWYRDEAGDAQAFTGIDLNFTICNAVGPAVPGCTNPAACNFNPQADTENGSCILPDGCTDPGACNYEQAALCDDGSCVYPAANDLCENAEWLTAGTPLTGDNTNACFGSVQMSCGSSSLTNDVWYRIPSLTGGDITVFITLNGSMSNSRIAVWDACGGTELFCNDEAGSPASSITFSPTCGDDYLVQVSCVDAGGEGSFGIQFNEASDPVACNDPQACNFSPCSLASDNCLYAGCTDVFACNFDPEAACDDGSCTGSAGCADPQACNFNPNDDCDLFCVYEDACGICGGSATNGNCSDPSACNYDPVGECTNSCVYPDACGVCGGLGTEPGCLDPTACNYVASANCFDFSCTYPGCTDPLACNYDATAGCDDGTCAYFFGCTDPEACNFNASAECDNGLCEYPDGCTDVTACNFNPSALCDDGSCILPDGCTNVLACNYDPSATCNDGSCLFDTPTTFQEEFCVIDFYGTGCASPAPDALGFDYLAENFEVLFLDGAGTITGIDITTQWTTGVGASTDFFVFFGAGPIYTENASVYNTDGSTTVSFTEADLSEQVIGATDDLGIAWFGSDAFQISQLSVVVTYEAEPNAISGCTNPEASNYNAMATCDDGSCLVGATCLGDLDGNGSLGTGDLLILLGVFASPCDDAQACAEDLDGNGEIGTGDLLVILGVFGTDCPQ